MQPPRYPTQAEIDRAKSVSEQEAKRLVDHFYVQYNQYNDYIAREQLSRRSNDDGIQFRLDIATVFGGIWTILSLGVLTFAIYHQADLSAVGAALATLAGSGTTFSAGVHRLSRRQKVPAILETEAETPAG